MCQSHIVNRPFRQITFTYDLHKDVENIVRAAQSVNNPAPTRLWRAITAQCGEQPTTEEIAAFIRAQDAKESVDWRALCSDMQAQWDRAEVTFVERAQRIFGIALPHTVTAYITHDQRCTYAIAQHYFFVSATASSVRLIVMHELFHFYTWYAYGRDATARGLSKSTYNNIKEALTVLLNEEFADLLDGAIDRGYPQHAALRAHILTAWRATRSLQRVIDVAVA